jgi:hypothetical protein
MVQATPAIFRGEPRTIALRCDVSPSLISSSRQFACFIPSISVLAKSGLMARQLLIYFVEPKNRDRTRGCRKEHDVRKQHHGMERDRAACDEAGVFCLGWSLAMVAAAEFCWTEVIPAACKR